MTGNLGGSLINSCIQPSRAIVQSIMNHWFVPFVIHFSMFLNDLILIVFCFISVSAVRKDPGADTRIPWWIQSLHVLPVEWQQRQTSVQLRLHSPVCLRVSCTHNSFHCRPQKELVVNLVSEWVRGALSDSGLSLQSYNNNQYDCLPSNKTTITPEGCHDATDPEGVTSNKWKQRGSVWGYAGSKGWLKL